ncbi:hypothetical protein HDV05_007813 [Chytridiales sp. JEL 0842]|nr:hypothetical protein HDV05_007813 [Chytridiales sp. JEL 0842]
MRHSPRTSRVNSSRFDVSKRQEGRLDDDEGRRGSVHHRDSTSHELHTSRWSRFEKNPPPLPPKDSFGRSSVRERERSAGRKDSNEKVERKVSSSTKLSSGSSIHRHLASVLSDNMPEDFDEQIDSGIQAMMACIASIPDRYYKYNTALSKKMDIALSKIDKLQDELGCLVENPSATQSKYRSGRTSLAGKTPIARANIIKIQILGLLQAVWRTAWERYSPRMRQFHCSDVETPQNLQRAEHALNMLHMWRRTLDNDTSRALDRAMSSGTTSTMGYISDPTHLFRRSPYSPPYIYVAVHNSNRDQNDAKGRKLLQEMRSLFIESIVREKAHRDKDLDAILDELIETRRMCEDDGDFGRVWNYVRDRLRKEFWLGGMGPEKAYVKKEEEKMSTNLRESFKRSLESRRESLYGMDREIRRDSDYARDRGTRRESVTGMDRERRRPSERERKGTAYERGGTIDRFDNFKSFSDESDSRSTSSRRSSRM